MARSAAAPRPEGSIKRSITVRPEIDAGIRAIAGGREYSRIANEAFLLYLQARGIEAVVRDIEATEGPITDADRAEVRRREEDARRRAQARKARRR